jgi:heptaprenyl diphosphate synthase
MGALCLFLSSIEYMIPKPLPFMRMGIANLPLLLGVDLFPFPAFMLLTALKIFGQALVTGTLFSYIFLFSLAGTTLAALTMYALRRALGPRWISLAGVGLAGALVSNLSQLALAWVFLFGQSVRYITPPFLGMGIVTGLTLGIFGDYFAGHSRWYAALRRGP